MTNAQRFLVLIALGECLLIAATSRLWFNVDGFPALPMFSWLASVPVAVDRFLTVALIGCCLALSTSLVLGRGSEASGNRSAWRSPLPALVCGIALVLLNQHRLQAWHWLFLLISTEAWLLPSSLHDAAFRRSVAAVYIFAGLSRLSPEIDQGMSLPVLTVILTALDLGHLLRDHTLIMTLCTGMSAAELLIGIGLLFRRFQTIAAVGAVGMHLVLICVLSPFGLHHHPGVLLWNVVLALSVPALFLKQRPCETVALEADPAWSMTCLNAVVFGLPLLGLLGFWDNWLSWQLYSPRPEVVQVFVSERGAQLLPRQIARHCGQPAPLDPWRPLRLDRWSLETTGSPIYPEDRFQLAVASEVAKLLDLSEIRIKLDRPKPWFWWQRESIEIEPAQLPELLSGFRINAVRTRS
ncbi:MAG: hypothetical protein R3C49_18250 [Planctomycetaceae bacterium]